MSNSTIINPNDETIQIIEVDESSTVIQSTEETVQIIEVDDDSNSVVQVTDESIQIIEVNDDSNTVIQIVEEVVQIIEPGSEVKVHNSLYGLQGGTTDEYYHLTSAEHTKLINLGLQDLNFTGTNGIIFGDSPAQTKIYQNSLQYTTTLPKSDGTSFFRVENSNNEPTFSITDDGTIQSEHGGDFGLTFIDPLIAADTLYLNTTKTVKLYTLASDNAFVKLDNPGVLQVWLDGDSNGDSSFNILNSTLDNVFKVDSSGRMATINAPNSPLGITDFADFSGQPQQVVSITRSGSTATVTTTLPHNRATGDGYPVTITGANETEYNGSYTLTKIDDTSFSYTVSGTPATPATGTIYYSIKALISNVQHGYKDGHLEQKDYVGESGYTINRWSNANNSTRRPDKDPTFYGQGNYWAISDENGLFNIWFGTNREETQMQGTRLKASNVLNADPAYQWRCYQLNSSYFRYRTPNAFADINQYDNAGNPAMEFVSGNTATGGLRIKATAAELTLEDTVAGSHTLSDLLPTIEDGTATGQMTFWDNTLVKWQHTETNELFWDDINKRLGIATTAPRRKLDALDAVDPQIRLTHTDNSVYTDLETDSSGNLIVLPSGEKFGINITPEVAFHVKSPFASLSAMLLDCEAPATTETFAVLNFRRSAFGDGDGLGIAFNMRNSLNLSNVIREYGYIGAIIEDNTQGTEDGSLAFYTMEGGSNRQKKVTINSVGNVGIGTATPNTTLDVQGGQTVKITTVNTATYALLISDYTLHVTYAATGAITITLPTAQSVLGRIIIIKDAANNAVTNNITIATGGAELIEFGATYIMNTSADSKTFYSDGTDWFII